MPAVDTTSALPRRKQVLVEARRDQILNAAWACFAEKGYRGTTMQDIGAAAGMSAAAIYLYFESKEAVLNAINQLSQEMGRRLVSEALSSDDDPIGALRVIGAAMLSVFEDPQFESNTRVNLETLPEFIRRDDLRKGLREEMDFWREAVGSLLQRAQQSGELRPEVDIPSLTVVMISAWLGLRQNYLVDPEHFRPESLLTLMRLLVPEEVVANQEPFPPPTFALDGPPWRVMPPRGRSKEAR
jgi:AcrR family transcriptional regulator